MSVKKCKYCKGSGRVWDKGYKDPFCSKYDRLARPVPCKHCYGKGVVSK